MDEMEGLAIKITRAEWGVLKGWVPEIVANEVAGKLVEVIRPLLADAIAANAATIAVQAAEIERLKENRDYWMAQYERAYELAQSRAKDAELADLRSQLEEQRAKLDATEKLVNMFAQLPSGLPDLPTEPGWIEFRRPREGLPHWRAQKCDFAGGPVTERLRADSFIELALVVDDANWLTPHAEKEARP